MNSRMVFSFNSPAGDRGSGRPFAVFLCCFFYSLRHERFLPQLGWSGAPLCVPTPPAFFSEFN